MTAVLCGGCQRPPVACVCRSSLTPDGGASGWLAVIMLEAAEAIGQKIAESRCRIYAADLQAYDPADVIAAFRLARKATAFYPTIAEIEKCLHGTTEDAAVLAWNGLLHAAEEVGAYRSIVIEDPVTAAAVQRTFGSWTDLCLTTVGPDLAIKRQAFLAAYRTVTRDPTTPREPVRLAGLLETSSQYERRSSVWTARLTARGDVEQMREGGTLPAGRSVGRLTDGGADGEAGEAG